MRKILLYICAVVFLIGGVMGIIKSLLPNMEWLSFRALLSNTPVAVDIPPFIRIYSIVMGVLEIFAAIVIFSQKKRLFFWLKIMLVLNMAGCIVAIVMGDFLAIASLILRFIPIYIIEQERRTG